MKKQQKDFEEEVERIIKAREIRVVRNGKPVLHSKQFYDSANPERSVNKIHRSKE